MFRKYNQILRFFSSVLLLVFVGGNILFLVGIIGFGDVYRNHVPLPLLFVYWAVLSAFPVYLLAFVMTLKVKGKWRWTIGFLLGLALLIPSSLVSSYQAPEYGVVSALQLEVGDVSEDSSGEDVAESFSTDDILVEDDLAGLPDEL